MSIEKWITDALEHSNGTHKLEDILHSLQTGEMQLWANDKACVVSLVQQYPQKKVCFIFLAGGELESVLKMQPQVTEWAKAQGCELLSMVGRKGWAKALNKVGWKSGQVCMTRNI